ncbi:MAG: SAM-dependent chlorinase/fluorinase [bacterium]
MAIITLITDFGIQDNYVGIIKGVIYSINQDVEIIDITHLVNSYDLREANFILKSSFKYFPKGTIHVVVVDPGVGSEREIILMQTKNYYFLAPNNGILDFAFDKLEDIKIVEVTNKKYFLDEISSTFHGRDIFAPVAAYLSLGKQIEEFGHKISKIKTLPPEFKPKFDKDKIVGEIIYIDHFGNLITNIVKEEFTFEDSQVSIEVAGKQIKGISQTYSQLQPAQLLALWDSSNHLEIAANLANAQQLLQIEKGKGKVIVKKGL